MTDNPLASNDAPEATPDPDAPPFAGAPPDNGVNEPQPPILTPVELRVLGSLIEKEISTPEYYPLTLNALTLACNQKSNRDPAMNLAPSEIEQALDTLRYHHHLAARVHTPGSRVNKFRHTLANRFNLSPEQTAILCELIVRGPQTAGELRGRASRLAPFDSIEAVEQVLKQLQDFPEQAMVVQLARESGRREARCMHLLGGPPDAALADAAPEESGAAERPVAPTRLDRLEAEIQALREQLDSLRQQVEAIAAQRQ